jgi:oligoendopeptidase F
VHARRFENSLQAATYANNVPESVFHNLIAVFKENLSTWHRYWRVRRRALGVDSLHVYDIKAPLTEAVPRVSYAQAVAWIAAGMAPLGEEYVSVLRQGCTSDRWIDRARNKGKAEGAYSSGSYDTAPLILMSYADNLESLSTLAHELGHSLHTYYSNKNQPYLYSDYSMFVAEVASNFNQAMVRDYLLRSQPETSFQIALIEEAMSNFHRYFFIMPTLARFELQMHTWVEDGAPISAEILNDLMADLFEEGYGGEVKYERPRVGITWAQFGHLYANFYVYQYATGISGAHALARGVLDGQPGAAERYLNFLKAGGSVYPLDALRQAGVDLTGPAAVEEAFAHLSELVDRLESLIGGK